MTLDSNRDAAITTTVYPERRALIADSFGEHDIDGFLSVEPRHVHWLSGFHGSNAGVLLAAHGGGKISTDSRYTTAVKMQAPDLELVTARDTAAALSQQAPMLGITKLGFEAELMTVAQLRALEAELPVGVELVPTTGIVEKLRVIKTDPELDALRDVAEIAADAYRSLLHDGIIAAGKTEREVAAELEFRMRIRGADGPSFDTIVASGPNSAKPHHGAEDRVLEEGDLVTLDFGALKDGFNSDMTRTVFVGDPASASEKAREIYRVVDQAQAAGIAAARAGESLVEIDKVCRDIITRAGFGEYFVHSTGHGVGIEVHEMPFAAQTGSGTLAPKMTLTIEPGIYIPGVGGVRIEDTLIITDGDAEVITNCPTLHL